MQNVTRIALRRAIPAGSSCARAWTNTGSPAIPPCRENWHRPGRRLLSLRSSSRTTRAAASSSEHSRWYQARPQRGVGSVTHLAQQRRPPAPFLQAATQQWPRGTRCPSTAGGDCDALALRTRALRRCSPWPDRLRPWRDAGEFRLCETSSALRPSFSACSYFPPHTRWAINTPRQITLQRILFHGPPHLRRGFLEPAEGAQTQT